MEESQSTTFLDGDIIGITFGLASRQEICTASISDCPISHASQLTNPFLGLPLEFGKCESCGTSEPGKCEGHFGYIELPIPIYHPSHVSELKKMLSLLCLKCLKLKNNKLIKNNGIGARLLSSCCEEASQVSIKEVKTADGASYLELKLPSKLRLQEDSWNFLERYGFRYGDSFSRNLLPCEVLEILKKIPQDSRKKLSGKGYFPQDGYILQYLPVPPNCLSVPDVSDGVSVMSSDLSISVLKKVLKQIDIIKRSRSGIPNFESHEVEANDLQSAVHEYLQIRGTAKSSRDVDTRFGVNKEPNISSTKAWLEKIRTLFIRKGSGFSSRSVITGDSYKRVNELGIPSEVAQRITFEERVNVHNMKYLQELVDNKLCLTYTDGSSTYSLREGSKGHTSLRPGQVVHRRIMDGDIVFINRPPTTHKHSLQALAVYVHEDHTVKINPLICGPLSADFDGDCVHLFYPQSFSAKAEVLELFSMEKQLLSSHSGNLNLQLATDSLLSLKVMVKMHFLNRSASQQLAMFVSSSLPQPALLKAHQYGPCWTALQMLQTALPASFDCVGDRFLIRNSELLEVDPNRGHFPSIINEISTSIFFEKGPEEVLSFFNSLQPLLMEYLFSQGFSVGLEDFSISWAGIQNIQNNTQEVSSLLLHLRSNYNELVELQLNNHIRLLKVPIVNYILHSSLLGEVIDSKSDSAINKVVQQVGFLGLQLSDRGKFYSNTLIEDVAFLFEIKYPFEGVNYPSAKYGLIKSCFFLGLDPYEEMVHSISTREVMVRSSRGLSEPGTLFKNLMAILRDVVICYDGTVRNVSSNSIVQFEYGGKDETKPQNLFPAGEPVGVLAATAISNPAYKAVLDSSPSSNSSWELMKEILLCRANFSNDLVDRRVILYLNHCSCGKTHCQENAALLVMNQLKKISLKDAAVELTIEYKKQRTLSYSFDTDAGLVGHLHLNKVILDKLNLSMHEVLQKCQGTIDSYRKKKKVGHIFKRTVLSVSEFCSFKHSCADQGSVMPCLMFYLQDSSDTPLEKTSRILADMISPVLLETVVKGDPRISSANIIWISPETTTWIRNPCKTEKGELALDIVLEKSVVKQSGDAWRVVLDSCLPVLDVIDTKRSIPYAIKQVQELLGISCAFEQAVQRLSTSVTMVAKGILKEHLILLANSMTCAGNLIGFNSGGYKALSRSLNVQVPFTEATLFTPRKCFERAAEKCHTDSLSSIVGSCSWGKHVGVGTGSKFDVLWKRKEVGVKTEDSIDVYSFLHMVRSSSTKEESNTGCLGLDVDDLMLEDENAEWCLSPELEYGVDKPFFEDSADFNFDNQVTDKANSGESSWEKASAVKQGTWSSWQMDKAQTQTVPLTEDQGGEWASEKLGNTSASTAKQDGWSGWGVDKARTEDAPSTSKKTQGGWGAGKIGNTGTSTTKVDDWSDWATDKARTQNASSIRGNDQGKWGAKEVVNMDTSTPKVDAWSGWGVDKAQKLDSPSIKAKEESSKTSVWGDGELQKEAHQSESSSTWGRTSKDVNESGTHKNNQAQGHERDSSSWDNLSQEKPTPSISDWASQWKKDDSAEAAKNVVSPDNNSSWGNQKDLHESPQAWGSTKDPSPAVINDVIPDNSSSWGNQKDLHESPCAWGAAKDSAQAVSNDATPGNSCSWGKQKDPHESPRAWGSTNESSQPTSLHGWDSSKQGGPLKKNRFEGSRGWGSNSSEWKNKNHPPKSPGMGYDSGASGIFTVTRQRLDMFTSEEQDVLLEIELIMKSIRRIMHQSGYNDGDPLSADDQAYILENVFAHHPDKELKMGAGVDHIMVNRHNLFPESRCFFISTTDERKEDFSYRKCLDSYIRGKYPDIAEQFIPKYFKKPRVGNRERNNVEETAEDNKH